MRDWWMVPLIGGCVALWLCLQLRLGFPARIHEEGHRKTTTRAPPQSFEDRPSHPRMNRVDERLYVGNFHAASAMVHSAGEAGMFNITAVLNVAWDCDLVAETERMQGTVAGSNLRYAIRYAKAGLVDGPGNTLASLAAAVHLLASFLEEESEEPLLPKDANIYARPRGGAVLIHCVFGQSRSVIVAALYMYYSGRFDTLDAALDWLRSRRSLPAERYPQRDLLRLAHELVKTKPDLLLS